MEIFNTILIITWRIMCISACLMMSYAILSVLIETIKQDIFKRKEIGRLMEENVELREKINQLEMELIDNNINKQYNKD